MFCQSATHIAWSATNYKNQPTNVEVKCVCTVSPVVCYNVLANTSTLKCYLLIWFYDTFFLSDFFSRFLRKSMQFILTFAHKRHFQMNSSCTGDTSLYLLLSDDIYLILSIERDTATARLPPLGSCRLILVTIFRTASAIPKYLVLYAQKFPQSQSQRNSRQIFHALAMNLWIYQLHLLLSSQCYIFSTIYGEISAAKMLQSVQISGITLNFLNHLQSHARLKSLGPPFPCFSLSWMPTHKGRIRIEEKKKKKKRKRKQWA